MSVEDKDFKFVMDKLKMDGHNLHTLSLDENGKVGRYITQKLYADVVLKLP